MKRIYWALFALAIFLLISSLVCWYIFFNNGKLGFLTKGQKEVSTSIDNEFNLKVFYYTVDYLPQRVARYKIFTASPVLGENDVNTHSFDIQGENSFVANDSGEKNKILIISDHNGQAAISSLDISSPGTNPQALISFSLNKSKSEVVSDVRYVDEGKALAIIVSEVKGSGSENSVLEIIPLKNKDKKEKYFLNEENLMYARLSFLTITPDSKIIYLQQRGGDGGYIWSQWYKVDRESKIVQKLEGLPPFAKGEDYPTVSVFSPDATKLAYIDFSSLIPHSDLNVEGSSEDASRGCLKDEGVYKAKKYDSEGGVVMVRDLLTGEEKEVFRNLSYSDNLCMNIARRIISLKWLDNSRLIFETIDGVYSLNIKNKDFETLFFFERTFSPGKQARPSLLSVQLPFVVFSDGSIAKLGSNKLLSIYPSDFRAEFFMAE